MDENLPRQTRCRISGMTVPVGRDSTPSSHPGQNERFSDGIPTNSPVVALQSGQPGKSTKPKNPMKTQEYPPSQGFPPVPPSSSVRCEDGCGSMALPESSPDPHPIQSRIHLRFPEPHGAANFEVGHQSCHSPAEEISLAYVEVNTGLFFGH